MIKNVSSFIHGFRGSLKTNLFRQISVVFLWDNVSKMAGLITTVLLIRMMSKEDYAMYAFFWTSIMFFLGTVTSGIDMAYVRFAAEEYSATKKHPNDIFMIAIMLCALIFLLLAPVILLNTDQLSSLMFKNPGYGWPLFLGFITAIGLFFINIIARYYQIQERYQIAGIINNLQNFMFLIVLLFIRIFRQVNFKTFSVAQTVVIYLFAFFYIGLLLKNKFGLECINLTFQRFREFIRTSFWLIMYFLAYALFAQMDMLMVSRFRRVEDVATYGVALRYYVFLMAMFPAIKTVLKVRTAKIDMVESTEKQLIFFKKWIKYSSCIFVPLFTLIIFLSDYFMAFLNGSRYTQAIPVFKILAVSATFSYLFSPLTDVFRAMKKYFLLFCLGLVALTVCFFLNLILVPTIGICGAAIASLLANVVINGSATVYIFSRKSCISSKNRQE